jgi:hypothetical protein
VSDQAQRINAVVSDALASHEDISYAVGHFFGSVPIPNGTAYIGPAWIITLTMRSPLLGNPDIAPAMPIPAAIPTDGTIRLAVAALLTECLKRHQAILDMREAEAA